VISKAKFLTGIEQMKQLDFEASQTMGTKKDFSVHDSLTFHRDHLNAMVVISAPKRAKRQAYRGQTDTDTFAITIENDMDSYYCISPSLKPTPFRFKAKIGINSRPLRCMCNSAAPSLLEWERRPCAFIDLAKCSLFGTMAKRKRILPYHTALSYSKETQEVYRIKHSSIDRR